MGRSARIGTYLLSGLSLIFLVAVAAVAEARPKAASPLKQKEPEALEEAAKLYGKFCSRCHGVDYRGRNRSSVPDFTSGKWQKSRSDAQLQVSIRDGKGWAMPEFSGKLSDRQIRALVRLIRRANPTKPVADEAPDDFARRFALLEEELKDLQRQFRELDRTPTRTTTPTPPSGVGDQPESFVP